MSAMPATTTELEKTSLEAHVDLCAVRYGQLDDRLSSLESKVSNVHKDILSGQQSLTKVIIGTAGTVIAGIISIVIVLLMRAN